MQALSALSAFVALAMVHLPASPDTKISLELKNVSPKDAIIKVVEASGPEASYVSRELPEEPRINLKLRNVQPLAAMKMVCEAAGLGCEEEGGGDLIIRRGAAAMIGGQEVPLIGALSTGGMGGADIVKYLSAVAAQAPELAKEVSINTVRALGKGGEVPKFPGEDALVDLEVKEAPLPEVAARLTKAVQAELDRRQSEQEKVSAAASPGVRAMLVVKQYAEIVVADSAKDLKVTARISKWPVRRILEMLLEQTNLTCTEERQEPPKSVAFSSAAQAPLTVASGVKLYLVPKPVLEVTGPGAIPRGGMGGGGSGRPYERRLRGGGGEGGAGGIGGGGGGGGGG